MEKGQIKGFCPANRRSAYYRKYNFTELLGEKDIPASTGQHWVDEELLPTKTFIARMDLLKTSINVAGLQNYQTQPARQSDRF